MYRPDFQSLPPDWFGSDLIGDGSTDVFVAQLTAATAGSGAFSGQTVYDWTEQTLQNNSGAYQAALPARVGTYSVNGISPLVEANNAGPASAVLPVFALVRLRGIVGGVLCYEFYAGGGAGAQTFNSTVTFNSYTIEGKTAATINTNQTDYAAGTTGELEITTTSGFNMNSIAARVDGATLTVINSPSSTKDITFPSNSSGLSANRFYFSHNAPIFLSPGAKITFQYDANAAVLSGGAGGGWVDQSASVSCKLDFARVTVSNANLAVTNTFDTLVSNIATLTAARTITLPPNSRVGQLVVVKDEKRSATATNTLSVVPSGSDTINNGSGVSAIAAAGVEIWATSDGASPANWTAIQAGLTGGGGGGGGGITSMVVGTVNQTLSNTTSGSLIGTPASGSKSMAAGFQTTANRVLRITSYGIVSLVTGSTLSFILRDTTNSIDYLTFSAGSSSSVSPVQYFYFVQLSFDGTNYYANGVMDVSGVTALIQANNSAAATGSAGTLDLILTMGTAAANNSVTSYSTEIEIINPSSGGGGGTTTPVVTDGGIISAWASCY